jgi:hypothetical protein
VCLREYEEETVTDPVQQQIDAYNSRDLDGFVDAYAEDAVIVDGEGNVVARGHDGIRDLYGELFSQSSRLHGEVLNRIAVGEYVIDEERVTGIEMEGSSSECTRPWSIGSWRARSPTCGYSARTAGGDHLRAVARRMDREKAWVRGIIRRYVSEA